MKTNTFRTFAMCQVKHVPCLAMHVPSYVPCTKHAMSINSLKVHSIHVREGCHYY